MIHDEFDSLAAPSICYFYLDRSWGLMREEVGYCKKCGRKIECLDGFLNGVIDSKGFLICFRCDEKSNSNGEGEEF